MQRPQHPFLGRPLEGKERVHVVEDQILAISVPATMFLGGAAHPTLAGGTLNAATGHASSPLDRKLAALLHFLVAVHESNDDKTKRIYLELVPAAATDPLGRGGTAVIDLAETFVKGRLSTISSASTHDPYFDERLIAVVRMYFVADRTAYLPTRSVLYQIDALLRRNQATCSEMQKAALSSRQRRSRQRTASPRRRGGHTDPGAQCSAVPAARAATSSNLQRSPLLSLLTHHDLEVALSLLTPAPDPGGLQTPSSNADDDEPAAGTGCPSGTPLIRSVEQQRLAAHLLKAFSLDTAVTGLACLAHKLDSSGAVLSSMISPDFGDVASYRQTIPHSLSELVASDNTTSPIIQNLSASALRFPRREMVFVIDSHDGQQSADRFLATELPRPRAPHKRYVSAERRALVEARHGVPALQNRSDIDTNFYFQGTEAGRAYSALVGREGTDLLVSQAHQKSSKEMQAANVAEIRAFRLELGGPGVIGSEPNAGEPGAGAKYSRLQASMLRRCDAMLQPAWGSHSVASRAAAAELRRYLAVHQGVLFREQPKLFADLGVLSSWLCERETKARTLYKVHRVRTTMLSRMLLCLLSAADPDASGKLHHLALGPAATGKSFCANIVKSWAVPGQTVEVAHKSAMADTIAGNYDGQVEIWHESPPAAARAPRQAQRRAASRPA
jgi:hypothetical protein